MNQTVILFETGSQQLRRGLTATLEAQGFQVLRCRSIADLEKLGPGTDCGVIILDLDSALVNSRVLRELKRRRPAMQLLGLSSRTFHPELKDAISNYFFACLRKPADPDDLIYLVKSIFCDATNSEDKPVEKEIEGASITPR